MVKKNKKIDDLENYRANTAVNAKQNNLNEKNYQ